MKKFTFYIFFLLVLSGCDNPDTKIMYTERTSETFHTGKKNIDSLKDAGFQQGLQGNFDKFKELSEVVAKLDSNDADNLSQLAGIYLIDAQYDKGLMFINKSIKLDKQLRLQQNFTTKACLYYELAQKDSADFYFNLMLTQPGAGTIFLNAIVNAFVKFKKYDQAKRYNELIFKYYPNDEDASVREAVTLISENKNEEAILFLNRVMQNKKSSRLYATRGMGYHNSENFVAALKDENEAIKLDSAAIWVVMLRGRTKQKMKDYKGAAKDYNYAIERGDTTAIRFYKSLQHEM